MLSELKEKTKTDVLPLVVQVRGVTTMANKNIFTTSHPAPRLWYRNLRLQEAPLSYNSFSYIYIVVDAFTWKLVILPRTS